MSKVDWINWKTNPNEIINPDKIMEEIDQKYESYNTYMNPVIYEGIKYEVSMGGLDKSSLNILGSSPTNELAINILDNINEIKNIIGNLKNQLEIDALEQKQIEKKQLIEAIESKIEKEEVKKKNNSNPEIEEHIKELKERLNLANSI